DFAAQLHKAVDNTLDAYGGDYDIQWFSAAEVAETNAARIKTDSLIALGLSLLLMLLLLWSFFHHFKALLVIVSSVGFGGLFAMALLGISGHTVSMIAVGAGSVILGIAIDYALHFITHYKFSGDARTALSEIIQPLTVGSLTTIAAFLSLLFIQAPAMRDLGLFAALALIGTILFVLVFLPHFMPRQAADWRTAAFFRRVADFRPERHLWLTVTVLGATLLLACFASRMRFDTDLQHINYMTPQQRHAFERVQAQTAPAPNSCLVAVRGNDMDEALQRYEQLDNSRLQPALQGGDVAEVLGVSRFLPSEREQRKRLGRWLQWCDRNGTEVTRQLQQSARAAGFKHQAFGGFTNQITNQCELLSYESFAPLTATLLQPYVVQDSICYVMAQVRCSSAEQLKAFMDTLPPEVTAFNPSSVMRESIGTLSADFDFVLWVCGGIVFVFLLLSFRRAETALISFLPMSVSWIWILGLMGCMQVPFNVVNIILATFIFGLGDDYAIFMMDGLIQEYSYGTRMLGIHKNAVLLSVLTLLAGIGTLVFAAHPAMRSLADVTFIGMLSVLLITYVLPPLLFHGLATRHQTPVNLQRIGYSIVTETFFVSSALLLSLWAALFFLLRRPTEARRLKLHQTMYRVTRFIIRHIPGAPFTLANPHGETFDRPAVIYANHQSRLDLMAIIGLTPKLVILTNDQVWNNPFYGRLIRHAEFYPVSKGFNEMLPKMRSLVQRGYSVVIVTEGTRSADCRIGRFHQGAWPLARELRIDLLPLVLHGFGHVLPKKNLMLRKGALHLEVGRRQPWPDDAADSTCRQAAKKARQFLTDELKRIGQEREDAAYWFPYVRYQYYYKDPAVYPILHRYSQRLEMLQQAVNEARRQSGYRTDTDDYGIRALIVALCV
ncbi:MAG: 1-acyl-sn-glycerol-3-phosphate acyltransferase, partial [Paludibacteraceae bacterium]|nr:1-acyl-sn-glycerol-3-phosphate acyltransferase [Paludibacteraceae bacterium]